MFTINFKYKKIAFKIFALLIIFTLINICLFIYIRDYSIGYRPLDAKAKALFKMYPDSQIIIGGDSTSESNIDPLILSPSSINIAVPAAGITSFVKALNLYRKKPFTKEDIIIINLSVLITNDKVIKDDKYIGQIDDFLDAGALFLLKSWRSDFFKNLFNVYQCRFSSCPFYLDLAYPDIHQTTTRGFRPMIPAFINADEKNKNFEDVYHDYLKEIDTKGVLFEAYQRNLLTLSKTGAKIIVVQLPFSSQVKTFDRYLTEELFHEFISRGKKECQKYSNCLFFDYIKWDNSQLGLDENAAFSDISHLTPEGAKKFSTIFKNDIEKTLSNGGNNAN